MSSKFIEFYPACDGYLASTTLHRARHGREWSHELADGKDMDAVGYQQRTWCLRRKLIMSKNFSLRHARQTSASFPLALQLRQYRKKSLLYSVCWRSLGSSIACTRLERLLVRFLLPTYRIFLTSINLSPTYVRYRDTSIDNISPLPTYISY